MKTSAYSVSLADGTSMPLLGFGTWQLRGKQAYRPVRAAIETGYRLIDTATLYGNERDVGRAIADSGIDRQELFITTKLPPDKAGQERATIEASLDALGLDYVDLWLVHWPPGDHVLERTWETKLAIRDEGLARSVGVSNFDIGQIDRLIAATDEAPSVNQVPWAPSRFDSEFLAASRQRGVVVEGYSPFKYTDLEDPRLVEIAERHGVSSAQVVLRWHLQHEIVAIPKSAKRERIASNFDVFHFELTDDEMQLIDRL